MKKYKGYYSDIAHILLFALKCALKLDFKRAKAVYHDAFPIKE